MNLCSYSLALHSHRSTVSVVCETDSDRAAYAVADGPVVAVVRGVQRAPPFETVFFTSVCFTVTRAPPLHRSANAKYSCGLCSSDPRVRTDDPAIAFSYIAAQRKASMNLGLASPTYAVNCKDHSGQSLCSPVNADALLIVRVSTRGNGLLLGTGATCCRVSIKACSVFIDRAVSASMSAVT